MITIQTSSGPYICNREIVVSSPVLKMIIERDGSVISCPFDYETIDIMVSEMACARFGGSIPFSPSNVVRRYLVADYYDLPNRKQLLDYIIDILGPENCGHAGFHEVFGDRMNQSIERILQDLGPATSQIICVEWTKRAMFQLAEIDAAILGRVDIADIMPHDIYYVFDKVRLRCIDEKALRWYIDNGGQWNERLYDRASRLGIYKLLIRLPETPKEFKNLYKVLADYTAGQNDGDPECLFLDYYFLTGKRTRKWRCIGQSSREWFSDLYQKITDGTWRILSPLYLC